MLLALFFLGLSLDQRHVLDVGRDVFGFIACGLAYSDKATVEKLIHNDSRGLTDFKIYEIEIEVKEDK
jgi:hypothetical protein